MTEPGELTILGATVRAPVDHVECFDAPEGLTRVAMTTQEVTSRCPVTGQPDLSSVEILYGPEDYCVESKSLKLYLWSFSDRSIFAEALACEIASEISRATRPRWVRVTVTQRPRGGITVQTVSEIGTVPTS